MELGRSNLTRSYQQELKPREEIVFVGDGWGGQYRQLKYFQTSGIVRNESR